LSIPTVIANSVVEQQQLYPSTDLTVLKLIERNRSAVGKETSLTQAKGLFSLYQKV